MITRSSTSIDRQGDRATITKSSVSRQDAPSYVTLVLAMAVIVLALAWGLYESIQVLTTGVIPRF
jgi:hypothetical protein